MTININSFELNPIQGDLDLSIAQSQTLSGIMSANQATAVPAGQAVTIDTSITAGNVIQFIAATAVSGLALGYLKRTVQSALFSAGDKVEVVGLFGPVMWLLAGGTVTPGATVEDSSDGTGVVVKNSGKARGIALEYATVGQLVRVMIIDPATALS